jgi:biotin operon repressor
MEWHDKAIELKKANPNLTHREIGRQVGKSRETIKKFFQSQNIKPDPVIDINKAVLKMTEKETAKNAICDKLNISERVLEATIEDLKDSGYLFYIDDDLIKLCKEPAPNKIHIEPWNGEKVIRRGLVSDTHLCSNAQQLTHLNAIYDIFQREGITEVLHCGDIVDGDSVYPGHMFEVFRVGSDGQKDYAVENYPSRPGMVTKFITGNHDLKWFNKGGYDIGRAIANERPDLVYLGQYYADVKLTDNCVMRLEHPLGKPAYAVSYKTQRKIDNMRGGEKPGILAEGHYHYSNQMFRRNVHAFCVPSFQGPTKFSNRLGLENENGGYILEIHVDDDGTITRLITEFIPFYKVTKNDY